MKVELLAVGTELLAGASLETNTPDLARRLSDLGFTVTSRTVLPDDAERLAEEVRSASRRAELVVITGGLGPTRDDVTREALARASDRELIADETVLEGVQRRYSDRNAPIPDGAERQALRPEGSEVLSNRLGTAPGLFLRVGKARVAALPGVPREMVPMFEKQLLPRLREFLPARVLALRRFKIAGRSEPEVDERLGDLEVPGVSGVSLLASPGVVEVQVRVSTVKEEQAKETLDAVEAVLADRFGDDLFGHEGESLAGVVGSLLRQEGQTLAVAESCTGGMLSRFLTDNPGSSEFFLGGIVAYSNELKRKLLGVPEEVLERYGAVSAEAASAMASGARSRTEATHALAVTGIAGPSGGSVDKPLGLTFIAAAGRGTTEVRRFLFSGDRKTVRRRAAQTSLDLLRRRLLGLALPGEEP